MELQSSTSDDFLTIMGMILRRILISSAISTFYLTLSQSINCQNCTSSKMCNPSNDICTNTNCFIVSVNSGKYMTNGCATIANGTLPPDYMVNGTNVNGVCFWTNNITRICACRTSQCNNLVDSDKFPVVLFNPLPSIDIDAMLNLAEQSPATMATTLVTTAVPEATTKHTNRSFFLYSTILIFFVLFS